MLDEKMISTIILTNGHEKRLRDSINSILNQDYVYKELIIVSSELSDALSEYMEEPMIKIHIKPEFSYLEARDYALGQVRGEYIFFLNPLDTLIDNQSFSDMYRDMEENDSNFLTTAFIDLKDGLFYFGEPQKDVEPITSDDYWFHFVKKREIRPIYGKLFAREILDSLNVRIESDQQLVKYLILNARNPIFDKKGSGKYVWFKDADRHSLDLNRAEIPVPKYLGNIDATESDIDKFINVAICIDDNYCQHINPMVYSIEKNTTEKVIIHIVYYKLNSESLENIFKLNEILTNVELKLCKVKEYQYEWLSKFKENDLPTEAYFRLLLPDLLPNVKRILYLDVDMLVLNDLGILYRTDLGNSVLGVVRDFPFTNDKNSWSYLLLGESGDRYFNSGMLLMNLALMRENNIVEKFMKFILKTSQHYFLGDQDAFNVFFFYNVKLLEDKYNYIVENQKILQKVNFDVVIMHFCGFSDPKPWKLNDNNTKYILPSIRMYREYQRKINNLIVRGPKILIIVEEADNFIDTNKTIASINYQNYGNYEMIFQPLKENSNSKKLEELYPQLISSQINDELRKDIDYLFYLRKGSYFTEWNALSLLIKVAIEKNADYVMPSHKVFKVKDGNFYVRND
ncbi:glycosyltransferase, partial (plasmid) [Lactobacillus salivarius]|nr:glycosyltransferase [Ligilactobacillus salivarius]MSE07025.1 glycosyltransferase [Ligilactobacillus salivarius]